MIEFGLISRFGYAIQIWILTQIYSLVFARQNICKIIKGTTKVFKKINETFAEVNYGGNNNLQGNFRRSVSRQVQQYITATNKLAKEAITVGVAGNCQLTDYGNAALTYCRLDAKVEYKLRFTYLLRNLE